MEKIKEFFKDKKNIVICVCAILVIALVLFLIFRGSGQKKKLERRLNELGKTYYEKYYGLFDADSRSEFLAKYSTLGIKVDLENLARTVADTNNLPSKEKILKDFVNKKTGKECNQTTTKVIFYPQSPYGAKDYKMETQLDCGF